MRGCVAFLWADEDLGAVGQVAEEGGAGFASEADAAVGSRRAEDIAHMQADAIVREAHEEGHGAVVEVGAVVAVFFRDTESACGRGMGWCAGAHRKIHGQPTVHKILPALVGKLNDDAALRSAVAAAQARGVLPCAQGGAVGRAAAEILVVLRYALFI